MENKNPIGCHLIFFLEVNYFIIPLLKDEKRSMILSQSENFGWPVVNLSGTGLIF